MLHLGLIELHDTGKIMLLHVSDDDF
jgi:hypothetical protein